MSVTGPSPHLNRTEWSNRHKAALGEAITIDDKGLCGSTGNAYKAAVSIGRPADAEEQ